MIVLIRCRMSDVEVIKATAGQVAPLVSVVETFCELGVALSCVMDWVQVFIALGRVTGSTYIPDLITYIRTPVISSEEHFYCGRTQGSFNSWSQVSLQQTDRPWCSTAPRPLTGIPSGTFPHPWQPLRFEPCTPDLSGAACLKIACRLLCDGGFLPEKPGPPP